MDDKIEYVEEEMEVEFPYVEVPNDGSFFLRTDQDVKRYVIETLKRMNIDVGDVDELTLKKGDGVYDDDGISETPYYYATVTKREKRKVPYKVEFEEVYSYEMPNDPIRMSEEERKEIVYQAMEKDGFDIKDRSLYEIRFGEGVSDYDGISDSLIEQAIVYRVKKTRLENTEDSLKEDVPSYEDLLEKEKLEDTLKELKALREKLESTTGLEEREELIHQILESTEKIEEKSKDERLMSEVLYEELEKIDREISALQKELKEKVGEYEASYHKMQDILDKQNESLQNAHLTDEEILSLLGDYSQKKLEENKNSVHIKKQLEEQQKLLRNLKRKKNKIQRDIQTSDALGLTVLEYQEINSTLKKKNILNAILDKKGLTEIVQKKYNERTKEESKRLKEAKKEILEEISEVVRTDSDQSILDAIEALYSIQVTYVKGRAPRVHTVTKEELQIIKEKVSNLPERIIESGKPYNYVPGNVPEDMKAVMDSREKALAFGNISIDPKDLMGLSNREVIEAYIEEAKKDMRRQGVDFKDEDVYVVLDGAEDDSRDIQLMRYTAYSKEKEDTKLPKEENRLNETFENTEETESNERRDVQEKIFLFRDVDNHNYIYVKKYAITRFHLDPIGEGVRINGDLCYPIEEEDADFIIENANNDYSPYIVDFLDVHLGKKKEEPSNDESFQNERRDTTEKFVIYRDLNNSNEKYVKKFVISRFHLEPIGEEVRINGEVCYRIEEEDANFIIGNANNDYSPYKVEIKDIYLEKRNEKPSNESFQNERRDTTEKFVIYRDLDNSNEKYVKKFVISRFHLEPIGEEVRINGEVCYRIEEDDANFIIGNANNDYSPYKVEIKDVHLGKKKGPQDDKEETIILFRDLNDHNQIYASKAVLERFKIKPVGESTAIEGKDCYKISSEVDKQIHDLAKASVDPKLNVVYKDVRLKKKKEPVPPKPVEKSKPHVEAILQKLTKDLSIKANDVKRYTASNIQVSKQFKEDLHSGNVLYNIVHILPASIKAIFNGLHKLSSKIMMSKRAKEAMKELERRLNEDLTEEELETLFEEYKGSQLKTDMNYQINSLILNRLRQFGLEKVEKLNNHIKDNYSNLFSILGEVKVLEEKMEGTELSESERKAYLASRNSLLSKASSSIKSILKDRRDANNLLSSGVHGLEEDFKAVSTKLSYVGMRFGKKNDFDNELQALLAKYGQGLNDALSKDNSEEIVSNFMGLESCYYDNTKISKSVFGNRSVGKKYYSPLAEQFDYRDDPFIRDLFTTIATTTAAISAVNAIRVHGIEQARYVSDKNREINYANQANDNTMVYVDATGRAIQGKRGTFEAGMEQQMYQDFLNNANALERKALDEHGWGSFSSAYHAADEAHHQFYNQVFDQTTQNITNVATRYGSGAITQAQALQEISQLASGSQQTLVQVAQDCLTILKPYAQNHPQFDLHAVQESLEYITAHPTAISDMNQAMVDVTNTAGGLVGLSAQHVTALSQLPSDMLTTLVSAASATALAARVSSTMTAARRKGGYGNEVTEMMEDYLDKEAEEEETNTRHR